MRRSAVRIRASAPYDFRTLKALRPAVKGFIRHLADPWFERNRTKIRRSRHATGLVAQKVFPTSTLWYDLRLIFRPRLSVARAAKSFFRGRFVKRRSYVLLPMLISVGLLLGGCSSTGTSSLNTRTYDASKPQTFLAGAEVEQAKSLAMGSATTKGWKIVDSSGDRLVVTRPLSSTAAQSIAGEPVSAATVEVKSEFFKRQNGVDVVVDATMIANKGKKSQRRIDFTDSYKDDLNRSLKSLQRAWSENRWRVASATPPLATKTTYPQDDTSGGPTQTADAAPTVDTGSAYVTDQDTRTATATAAPAPAMAGTAAVAASTATSGAAPVEDRYGATSPPPVSSAAANAPASPSENMVVLNRQGQQGVWTYYAEHYAKIRGCQISDNGAVLQEKTSEYEVHRVYCEDEKTFLVKCNAGTCRGLE